MSKKKLNTFQLVTLELFRESCDRLYGSEICRRMYLRQMGKHQRIFRQEKGRGIDVAIGT